MLAPLHINKMDTSTGGPSQQLGPTPAALVLARSGGMPRVGALRLAASSAPTRPVPQRAIAARQEEEQSRLAIGPGNRIRPVGVADSSNTRVEVAAPLGAVMQHRTLVAGDGASAAAGILALPDAGPAAFAAVSLQMRAQRGQTPSAAEWRTMPQLRAEWWLCRHCRDVVNHNSATSCSRCASSVREMTPYASPAEVAALSANAQRTAYGRRLKSVQGQEQPVALAVAQTPGSAGYASAVLAQIASFQPGSKRLEAMVEPRVGLFDGWLALTTDGTIRFWTRDDVRAFFACGDGEALIAEYILSWGRRVDIGVEGQPLVVQAAPKGGWWMRTLSFVNERHIHMVRALLALVPDGAQDRLQWEKRVLYGPFPDDVYSALAAVTASIFSNDGGIRAWTTRACSTGAGPGRIA